MPINLKGLFSGGLKGLGDTAKNIIAQVAENKMTVAEADILLEKEVNRHTEQLEANALKETELHLNDVANSRQANTAIQDSEKASWLAKNVPYIMDLFVMFIWGGLTIYLMAVMLQLAPKQAGVDYTAVTAIWGAVSAMFGSIKDYHRGSSQGSVNKQNFIDRMMKK